MSNLSGLTEWHRGHIEKVVARLPHVWARGVVLGLFSSHQHRMFDMTRWLEDQGLAETDYDVDGWPILSERAGQGVFHYHVAFRRERHLIAFKLRWH